MNEAGVAAQLLALYAEPLLHRPALTHGRRVLPGAIHAFRFAQGRFPEGTMKELPAGDRARLREAAAFFIREVCLWEGATHYQVLGVSHDAPHQAIKEHYHALMGLLHPDRKGEDLEHWPRSAPARVNEAYAVLSDGARRRKYDAGLGSTTGAAQDFAGTVPDMPPMASASTPVRYGRAPSRVRHGRSAMIGMAALAGLFFLNAWWAGEVPGQYATLQSATPLEASWRWMRESLGSASLPRFLAPGEQPATNRVPDEEPVIVKRKLPAPALVSVSLAQPIAPAEVAPELVRIAQATPAPTDAPGSANRGEAVRAQPAPKAVPAQPPNPSSAEEAQIADLELLVTRLISLYEAGDIDKLVALVDPATIGTVEGASLHRDFNEFFRATRTRQLVLRTISWNAASPPTRARGEALLQVAYRDRPDRFERVVAVDVGIAWRNGRPWIARLSLFPHE